MNLQLQGKIALVTGSTAGIGLAVAAELAREGAEVIVNGRTQERVDAAMKNSGAANGIAADLATEAGAQAVFARFPEVDILVNNLGIFEPKPFEEIPDDDWRRFFEVNVLSGVRLRRHYIGPMKRKNWGRIIFISSESGLQIPPEMIHYGMTKTAQLAVSRGLAETTKGTAVTVNAVLPGPTASEGVTDFVDSNGEVARRCTRNSGARILPLGASVVADPALRRTGGSGRAGGVRMQPARFGHQWRRVAGRRWRSPIGRIAEARKDSTLL
jgi:NAD(P)-dependent dehydrogenase (short-subunit alcohol dehydrogenase family)